MKEYPSLDIAGVVISEADKRVMYVYAKSDNHWYWTTTTNGDSFEFHSNPLNVTYIRPHDKLSSIAIGTNWQTDCVRQCSSNYSDWHPNLMFSSDHGKNWEYVAEYAGTAAFVAKSQDINAENADFNKNSLLILEGKWFFFLFGSNLIFLFFSDHKKKKKKKKKTLIKNIIGGNVWDLMHVILSKSIWLTRWMRSIIRV